MRFVDGIAHCGLLWHANECIWLFTQWHNVGCYDMQMNVYASHIAHCGLLRHANGS